MVDMITYKAELLGMDVKLVPEEYTSQTVLCVVVEIIQTTATISAKIVGSSITGTE